MGEWKLNKECVWKKKEQKSYPGHVVTHAHHVSVKGNPRQEIPQDFDAILKNG